MSLEHTTKKLFSTLARSPAFLVSSVALSLATSSTLPALANPGDPARVESGLSAREREARDAGRRSLQENNMLTLHSTSPENGFTDFYVHSATALPEKIPLANGTYHMPVGLGSGDYKKSWWPFSKYAAFCEALEKRDQNECKTFVAYNVTHNSLRGAPGKANAIELDLARFLVLHREIVDKGSGKMTTRPTTKNDAALGVWDVLYDVTENRNDKNGRSASAFLSNNDEYFLLKTDKGERKFAHVYFRKKDELVAFLGDYTTALDKKNPQATAASAVPSASTAPSASVSTPPPVASAQPPPPPPPPQVPPGKEPVPDPRPPTKEGFLHPVENVNAGLTHSRTRYHDGSDIVSTNDTALDTSEQLQLRKKTWPVFGRARVHTSIPFAGDIDYQETEIGNHKRYRLGGDLTLAFPFLDSQVFEIGPYAAWMRRNVRFNFGEVEREETLWNYGLLTRGNFELFSAKDTFHLDLRASFAFGQQREFAKGGSDVKYTTLDAMLGLPLVFFQKSDCSLENSEHAQNHRCYTFSVTPYVGLRKLNADAGPKSDPNRSIDFMRYIMGAEADFRIVRSFLWMAEYRQARDVYPTGDNGPTHAVQDNRFMTGPRFQW